MRKHPYAAAWRNLERREKFLKIIFAPLLLIPIPELIIVPALFVAFYVFDAFSISALAWQIVLFVVAVTLCVIALSYPVLSFRCPRCDELFFFKPSRLWCNPKKDNFCAHCELAKDELPELPHQ